MSDDIPAHWLQDLDRRGLASYRKLGDAAGVSHETARRVILGRRVKDDTIAAIADAMGVSLERLHQLRGEPVPDRSRQWEPPAAASLLDADEREALSRLIGLMTRGRAGGGVVDATPIGALDTVEAEDLGPRAEPALEHVAAVLNTVRVEGAWSVAALADEISVPLDVLTAWFNGQPTLSDMDVYAIEHFLGVTHEQVVARAERRARNAAVHRAGEAATG